MLRNLVTNYIAFDVMYMLNTLFKSESVKRGSNFDK